MAHFLEKNLKQKPFCNTETEMMVKGGNPGLVIKGGDSYSAILLLFYQLKSFLVCIMPWVHFSRKTKQPYNCQILIGCILAGKLEFVSVEIREQLKHGEL